MAAENGPTSGPRRQAAHLRRVMFLLLCAGAIVMIVVLVFSPNSNPRPGAAFSSSSPSATGVSASSGPDTVTSGSPHPPRTLVPSPPSSSPAAPPLAQASVSASPNATISVPVMLAVDEFIAQATQISGTLPPAPGAATTAPVAPDFSAVARGAALGELEAQNQEFSSNGWLQTGTVTVVGTPTVSTRNIDGKDLIVVTACLDSSAVNIIDDTGATVLAAEKAGTRKNLNTYEVQESDGTWLVVDHTFPDDPRC